MVLEGECRIIVQGDGKVKKVLIYVPLDIARDSQFPFTETTDAYMIVSKEQVIIRKL